MTPMAASVPALMSVTGAPTLTGGRPGRSRLSSGPSIGSVTQSVIFHQNFFHQRGDRSLHGIPAKRGMMWKCR